MTTGKNIVLTRWTFVGKVMSLLFNMLSRLVITFLPRSKFSSVHFSSVAQSCPTLCDPMNCSMPGLPVHHQLPESTQTHVHWVSDAIQPSHPLLPPSPPTFYLSQHQRLLQWVSSSHRVAKVLEFQLHCPSNEQPGLISFRIEWTGWISLQSKGFSRVFSNATVQKHQAFSLIYSLLHHTWLLEKP